MDAVEREAGFLAEIKKSPDIILSDYSMPRFSGLRAVQLLRAHGSHIPFILISGTVGEETAVEAIRRRRHRLLAQRPDCRGWVWP